MSAPDTNIERQEQKHKVPLAGMKLAVGAVLALLVAFVIWTVAQGNEPEGADRVIDGRTGAVTTVDE